jgi:hypothetical protein
LCAIGGVFLIGYSLWKFKTERKRKKIKPQQLSKKADDTIVNKIQREQKQKEIEQLDKVKIQTHKDKKRMRIDSLPRILNEPITDIILKNDIEYYVILLLMLLNE